MSEADRARDRELMSLVRQRLVLCDPVGLIAAGAPHDEYDCLLGPLITGLRSHQSPELLATSLRGQLADHFGASPSGSEVAFADALIAWYSHMVLPFPPT